MISDGVQLREPRVGDLLAVPVTGAYCYTMSNNYNGARRIPVVFAGQRRRGKARRPPRDLGRPTDPGCVTGQVIGMLDDSAAALSEHERTQLERLIIRDHRFHASKHKS